jgi:hypothetical protein
MQKNKDLSSWATYKKSIKSYYNKYNIDINKAYLIAKRRRSKFYTNIDKRVKYFPFGFKSKDQFQKCHIYEYHILRDKIVECIRNNSNYERYALMIEDENNFLPLPEDIHRKFDAGYFTYNNGNMKYLNEKGKKFINSFVSNEFKNISSSFLNKKRLMYFDMRNYMSVEK